MLRGFVMRPTLIALPLLLTAAPAFAAKDPPKRPEVLDKLVSCRSIPDSAARLACYDTQVERLDQAEKNAEVVVLDKAEVKKARKGLFGFTIPDLGIFGGNKDGKDDPADEITEIESTLTSAGINRAGKWSFTIEDGARWVQTDTTSIRTPKVGMKVKIKKAALGSFFMNIAERPGFKVRREN
jgi:hypothetical protein